MKKKYQVFFAISLAVVGCQNYDDDLETLNSQIASLSSQLDGLTDVVSDYALLKDKVNPLEDQIQSIETQMDSIEAQVKENASAFDNFAIEFDDEPDPLIYEPFLKTFHNTAWIMTEESYTDYTLFYNFEESFIKFYDSLSFCDNSSQSVIQQQNQTSLYIETSLVGSKNSNRIIFTHCLSYGDCANGEYMVRETMAGETGVYKDTLYRAKNEAEALWSLWECS